MCDEWEDERDDCVCTDSIRSAIGKCPEKGHREYYLCPRREGLFRIEEVRRHV